ncbi:bifunctional phosphoglucose/phosphomannose isomerase [Thermus aquaticus]|uniref:Bifunctional phosphoglucose/phosphomannose isomerase n=1 Tax=Thermus aquaticus TaxID=271 RepID=A0A0M9AEK1_THEAQ|nr:SIS domain-containing protein [Thermus aquaticus]KOX89101.1 bifunctional phosphoglucose/phosphomannose isomerase [Thermus aquaticus]
MRDLDREETYLVDRRGLALELRDLVGTGPVPQGTYPGPHGVLAYGEGRFAAELLAFPEWVEEGTLFLLEGGYDLGEAAAMGLLAESGRARVVRVGFRQGVDVHVPPSPLSPYRYLRFLLLATGQEEALKEVDEKLLGERRRLGPEVPLEENPAKFLAYTLLERLPLFYSPFFRPLEAAAQSLTARIGKSLSLTPPFSALEFFLTGLEARHEQGDPLAAVLLGGGEAVALAKEILETRVDAVAEVPPPEGSRLAQAVALWYRLAWTAYYLALLYGVDPSDQEVLERLREVS